LYLFSFHSGEKNFSIVLNSFVCYCGYQVQERLSGLPSGSGLFIEAVTSHQHMLSILEEDFIELNDIV